MVPVLLHSPAAISEQGDLVTAVGVDPESPTDASRPLDVPGVAFVDVLHPSRAPPGRFVALYPGHRLCSSCCVRCSSTYHPPLCGEGWSCRRARLSLDRAPSRRSGGDPRENSFEKSPEPLVSRPWVS